MARAMRVFFHASGGNANVSLEYGYAEALDIPRELDRSTHGRRAAAELIRRSLLI